MFKFKSNFKEQYNKIENKEWALLCPLYQNHEDTQANRTQCQRLENNSKEVTKAEYESLLSERIDMDILVKYKKLWNQREDILN